MHTIFLDLRPKEQATKDPIENSINIPLVDIIFHHKLGKLRSLPKKTIIEYYYPFIGNIEALFIQILNENGFYNLNNCGRIITPPLIFEYKTTIINRPIEADFSIKKPSFMVEYCNTIETP